MHGQLPFPDGNRIVGIQVWDRQSGDPEHKVTNQFVDWRSSLHSFEDLAAYRTLESFDNAHIYPTVLDAVTAFRSTPDPSTSPDD